jgi:hypothetical protein
MFSTGPLQPVI